MARIRTVKPDLFRHEALFEAEQETRLPLRLAFIGLFTACDREGRFEWRPRALKLDVLPYDEIDFSRVLDALVTRGFVVKYDVAGVIYGCIPSFGRHQVINNKERASEYPPPPSVNENSSHEPAKINELSDDDSRVNHASTTRQPRDDNATLPIPRGREGKGREKEGNTAAQIAKNAIGLPLHGGGVIAIKSEQIARFKELYPNIDSEQELRNMIGWFDSRPHELRPRTAIMQFVNSWLANRQTDFINANRALDDLDDTSWANDLVIPGMEYHQ